MPPALFEKLRERRPVAKVGKIKVRKLSVELSRPRAPVGRGRKKRRRKPSANVDGVLSVARLDGLKPEFPIGESLFKDGIPLDAKATE